MAVVVARQHSLEEGLFCCCGVLHPPHSAATVSRMGPAFIPILSSQHSHQAVAHAMANAHRSPKMAFEASAMEN